MRRWQLTMIQLTAFWPVWRWYAARLNDGSDEPLGVLALLTAALFCLLKGKEPPSNARFPALGLILTAAYLAAFPFCPAIIRAGLAVTALAALLSRLWFQKNWHLGLCALLILSLPIIASLQFYCGYPLRALTTVIVSKLVGLSGELVTPSGTLLSWRGELVAVDAPCSGIKMLWAGLYLNFTLACFWELSALRTWLSYSLASLLIFIGNVLRTFILFYTESGIFQVPAYFHTLIGLVVFAMVAVAIVFMNRFLRNTYALNFVFVAKSLCRFGSAA